MNAGTDFVRRDQRYCIINQSAIEFFPWRMELDREFLESIRANYAGHGDAQLLNNLLASGTRCASPISKLVP